MSNEEEKTASEIITENSNTPSPDLNDQQEGSEQKNPEHSPDDDAKISGDAEKRYESTLNNLSEAQRISNVRLKEDEVLILNHVKNKADEAFYNLWCLEANDYFRLLLRFRNRAAKIRDLADESDKESA